MSIESSLDQSVFADTSLVVELPNITTQYSQSNESRSSIPKIDYGHEFQFGKSSYAPLAHSLSCLQDQETDRKLSKNLRCQVFYANPFCWNLILNQYISANLSNERNVVKSALEQLQYHYAELNKLLLECLLSDLESMLELLELINGIQQISRVFSTVDEEGNWVFIIQTAGGRTEKYKHQGTKARVTPRGLEQVNGASGSLKATCHIPHTRRENAMYESKSNQSRFI